MNKKVCNACRTLTHLVSLWDFADNDCRLTEGYPDTEIQEDTRRFVCVWTSQIVWGCTPPQWCACPDLRVTRYFTVSTTKMIRQCSRWTKGPRDEQETPISGRRNGSWLSRSGFSDPDRPDRGDWRFNIGHKVKRSFFKPRFTTIWGLVADRYWLPSHKWH